MFLLIVTFFAIFNPILSIPAIALVFCGFGLLHDDEIYGAGLVAIILAIILMYGSTQI